MGTTPTWSSADPARRARCNSGTPPARTRPVLNAEWADLLLGANGQDGSVFLFPKTATNVGDLAQSNIALNSGTADVTAGGGGQAGTLILRNGTGQNVVALGAETADLVAGGSGQAGTVILRNPNGNDTAALNGEWADLLGGDGQDGEVFLFPKTATAMGDLAQSTVILSTTHADIMAGGEARPGPLSCVTPPGRTSSSSVPRGRTWWRAATARPAP